MSFCKRFLRCVDRLSKAMAGAIARIRTLNESAGNQPVEGTRTLFGEAKARWPDASPEAIDELMWLTPYPLADRDTVVASLSRMRERWGSKIADAINGEMAEFDAAWQRERHKYVETP